MQKFTFCGLIFPFQDTAKTFFPIPSSMPTLPTLPAGYRNQFVQLPFRSLFSGVYQILIDTRSISVRVRPSIVVHGGQADHVGASDMPTFPCHLPLA